jgi:hypothetical protein
MATWLIGGGIASVAAMTVMYVRRCYSCRRVTFGWNARCLDCRRFG